VSKDPSPIHGANEASNESVAHAATPRLDLAVAEPVRAEAASRAAPGRSGGRPEGARVRAAGTVGPPLPSSPALELLIRRAAWLGRGADAVPVVSFTSLFLGCFTSHDELSLWVQDTAARIGPTVANIVRRWSHANFIIDEARVRTGRAKPEAELPAGPVLQTRSATQVMLAARELARRIGSDALDVRHVVAVYLHAPPGHGDDLLAWKLDRDAWAARLRCYLAARYPEEASSWRALHDASFPIRHSVGLDRVLRYASSPTAAATSDRLDAWRLLQGALLDGLARLDDDVATSLLVRRLGGAVAAQRMLSWPGARVESPPAQILAFADELDPVFDRARVFATASAGPLAGGATDHRTLHVRHVLAALLTDRRPLSAFELLRRAHRTPDAVLAQLRRWIDGFPAQADDVPRWRQIFCELCAPVVPGHDRDEARGGDCLSIGADVRALAAVIASTQVCPPLSIGLFGDGGSGKSFFMAKLRERVAQLVAAAKSNPTGASWFCGPRGGVVQIDFNAWDDVGANLWSSLAVRVFDALNDDLKQEFARDFILKRTATDEYRKHLGMAASIHHDFTKLVEFLRSTDRPPKVERVVLYIDDLDRCSPDRVVEVLQAIHIIVSLPLFVVVVGVDSRWLLDSLTTYHGRHPPGDGVVIDAARAQQYLERIVQIPFKMSPMSPAGYSSLVGSLLQLQDASATEAATARPVVERTGDAPGPRLANATPAAGVAWSTSHHGGAAIDLTPRALQLEPRERGYLEQLAPLVASPRETKRLVNLYRIVRCALDDQALDRLIDGDYKITQICLALVIGSPELSADLFGRITAGTLRSASELGAWINAAAAAPGTTEASLGVLRELAGHADEFGDWEAVRDAVCRVARFSFQTGRVMRVDLRELTRAAARDGRPWTLRDAVDDSSLKG